MSSVTSQMGNVPTGSLSHCCKTLIHIATKKFQDGVQCCALFLAAHLGDHDALTAVHRTNPRGVVRDSCGLSHRRVFMSVD